MFFACQPCCASASLSVAFFGWGGALSYPNNNQDPYQLNFQGWRLTEPTGSSQSANNQRAAIQAIQSPPFSAVPHLLLPEARANPYLFRTGGGSVVLYHDAYVSVYRDSEYAYVDIRIAAGFFPSGPLCVYRKPIAEYLSALSDERQILLSPADIVFPTPTQSWAGSVLLALNRPRFPGGAVLVTASISSSGMLQTCYDLYANSMPANTSINTLNRTNVLNQAMIVGMSGGCPSFGTYLTCSSFTTGVHWFLTAGWVNRGVSTALGLNALDRNILSLNYHYNYKHKQLADRPSACGGRDDFCRPLSDNCFTTPAFPLYCTMEFFLAFASADLPRSSTHQEGRYFQPPGTGIYDVTLKIETGLP